MIKNPEDSSKIAQGVRDFQESLLLEPTKQEADESKKISVAVILEALKEKIGEVVSEAPYLLETQRSELESQISGIFEAWKSVEWEEVTDLEDTIDEVMEQASTVPHLQSISARLVTLVKSVNEDVFDGLLSNLSHEDRARLERLVERAVEARLTVS